MTNNLKEYIENINAQGAAWVAEDPANRCVGKLTTDLAHWASYGITTPEELEKYFEAEAGK